MQEAQTEHKKASSTVQLTLTVLTLALALYLVYEQRYDHGASLTEYEVYGSLAASAERLQALPILVLITGVLDLLAGILVAASILVSQRRRLRVGSFGLVASVCLAVVFGGVLRTWLPWHMPLGVCAAISAAMTILLGPLLRERGVLHMTVVAVLVGGLLSSQRYALAIKMVSVNRLDQYRLQEYGSLAPIRFLTVPEYMTQRRRSALVHTLWSRRPASQIPTVLADWDSGEAFALQTGGIPGYVVGLPPDTPQGLYQAAVRAVRVYVEEHGGDSDAGISQHELGARARDLMAAVGIKAAPKPAQEPVRLELPFALRLSLTDDGPILHCDAPIGHYELRVATPGGSLTCRLELETKQQQIELPEAVTETYRNYIELAEPGMPVLVRLHYGVSSSAWIPLVLP